MQLTHMNVHHKLSNKPAIKSIIMLKKLTESEETWYLKSHSTVTVLEDFLGYSIPNNLYLGPKIFNTETPKEPRRVVPRRAEPRRIVKRVEYRVSSRDA